MNVSFSKEQIGKLPAWSGVLWDWVSLSQSEAKPSTKHHGKQCCFWDRGFLLAKFPRRTLFCMPVLTTPPGGYPHSSTSSTKLSQQFQLRIREWAHSKSLWLWMALYLHIKNAGSTLLPVPISQKAMESSWKTINRHIFSLSAPTTSQCKDWYHTCSLLAWCNVPADAGDGERGLQH